MTVDGSVGLAGGIKFHKLDDCSENEGCLEQLGGMRTPPGRIKLSG